MALLQAGDDLFGGFSLVVLVNCNQLRARLANAVGTEHAVRVARVFASNGVRHLQNVQRAQGDVGEVADGRGHGIERGGRVLLLACGFFGGWQGKGE
ncbi:hypothetical protein D3C72_1707780 [compost metagenome]